ncbi:MAG TPA: glycosyltransferase family 39 protein [Anaerolineae bacterium]|nr:glycosyltransferase family 39 protein [Anaerolineae bacterium]
MAEANRVNARPWFRNRELWFLVGVLVVSLTLRARLVSIDRIVRWDEPDYLTLGRHLITGQGYSVSGRVDVHYPPLFPLVTGLLYPLTHDMKLNSDICFVVFGALFLLPLYWLTKQLFGARVAAMTTLLVCIYPPLTS